MKRILSLLSDRLLAPTVGVPFLLTLLLATVGHVRAEQFGDFIYRVVGGTVEIVGYPKDIGGHVEIPAVINGMPVTAITNGGSPRGLDGAFQFSQISSVTIPEGVKVIGDEAFSVCFNLTSITIPDSVTTIGASAFYQSNGLTQVNFGKSVTSIGHLAFFACFRLTKLSFPTSLRIIGPRSFEGCRTLSRLAFADGITSIGDSAFLNCYGLKSVVLPASLSLMENNCFVKCTALRLAVFLGDAPTIPANSFNRGDPAFQVLVSPGSSEFTVPTWRGFPTEVLPSPLTAPQRWLLENGLAIDTDLQTHLLGTEMSHWLAYALDLDIVNPAAGLPSVVLNQNSLNLSFFGGRQDVVYAVETSMDLLDWTTNGVTVSEAGANGWRTASVESGPSGRYLRVVVTRANPRGLLGR